MKKFFTLIAMALMAIGANAQTEWNFSSWTAGDIIEVTTIDGLKIYATSEKGVTIDGSTKTVDEVKYTQRLKLNGGGVFGEDGTPSTRVLEFSVTGACDIDVVAISGNSKATDRYLVLKTSDGTQISDDATIIDGAKAYSYNYKYTGTDAATIYLYSGNSSINLYDIKITYSASGISSISSESAADAPAYNVAGQRVNKDAKGLVIVNGKKYMNK